MREESWGFLKGLLDAPSISGYEEPAQRVAAHYARGFAAEVRTDVHGNLLAEMAGGGRPRVLLTGHVDQVGMIVRHVTDEGYVHFASVGGAQLQYGQRAVVHTRSGPRLGVVGRKSHLHSKPEERDKALEPFEYWLDIGAESGGTARKLVAIGDPVTWIGPLEKLSDTLICGSGIDDKIGVFTAVEALRRLMESDAACAAHVSALSAVQEEVGCRGAGVAAYWAEPDVAIAVDVWPMVTDTPDTDKRRYGEMKLGAGPVVMRGSNMNATLFDLIVATAEAEGIPIQFCAWPGPTPTDAAAIFGVGRGVATGLIGLPQRYLHTPSEVVHLQDVENTILLLVAVCRAITPEVDFAGRNRVLSS